MKTENIEAAIKAYQETLHLLRKSESDLTLNQLVFKKYIEIEQATKVAQYLREKNIKLPNGTSIQQPHIKNILDSSPKDVHPGIINIAQSIFKKNQKLAFNIWN